MSCNQYRRSFESLTIENVKNLRFTRIVSTVKNPTKIVFKNVKYIDVIPENTFSIPHMVKYNGVASQHELQEILFEDVSIGTIEGHAFHSLRGFKTFNWTNVNVTRLHANAIKIHFNTTEKYQGSFTLMHSAIEISEYLSFQLYVKQALFRNNKFVEIMPGGINGTIETFDFFSNIINTLQPGAISILSKTVNIMDNTFNYLKYGSLEKISPGLLVDSHISFGNLQFSYKFIKNKIIYVDAGSLNPDMEAYNKVSTHFDFSSNSILCSCENMGWLMSGVGHGYSTSSLQHFYEIITDRNNSNVCSGISCMKMISDIKHLLKNDKCTPIENFCHTTNPPPNNNRSKELVWLNDSESIISGCHYFKSNFMYIIAASLYACLRQYIS